MKAIFRRKTLLILGLVYLGILLLGIVLLYALVPADVWQAIRTVYLSGRPEDF